MDYHAVHGHDVASFDISSSHRLPTVSASAALNSLENETHAYISTGVDDLDKSLLPQGQASAGGSISNGGVKRGQVTEIWGPPGTAKTSLGLQLAAHAACDGHGVVWAVASERVRGIFEAVRAKRQLASREGDAEDEAPHSEALHLFTHYECLTLPHLLALVSRSHTRSVPSNTGIVVISSVSSLINSALPKALDGKLGPHLNRESSPALKRRQALQTIMKGLQTLASTRNCAVVILSPCATKMHSERGATLTPAINTNIWDQGISTRLVLFRDWTRQKDKVVSVFLAGVQKVDGRNVNGCIESVSAMQVSAKGVLGIAYDWSQSIQREVSDAAPQKRKLARTAFEVPDSEDDEDYGWGDEDESALPPQPPQWQGSEDILLGQEVGHSDEEERGDSDHESARELPTFPARSSDAASDQD